jgi:sec-independent protein translocase protein TatB
MFDIGFSELLVIGGVALVVLGPERLPKVARTAGVLFGRLQRYVTQVKADINREMEMSELGKVKDEFESAARSFQTEVQSKADDVEREMREAHSSIERTLEGAAEPGSAPGPAVDAPSPQLELAIEEPASDAPPRGPAG